MVIQKYIIGGTATAPYVSINSGGSWTALDTTGFSNPRAAATPRSYLYKNHMIGTGSTHMCVVGYLSNSSRLWMTHNGGSTWTYSGFSNCTLEWIHTTPGNGNWYSAGWTYNLYQTSFNNGYTWTGRTMPTVGALNFSGSKNGQYVYAGTGNVAGTRRIQRSSNYGATFAYDSGAITTGGNGHLLVECDDTGQYVAAYYGGNGTTSCGMNWSSNYGASFTKLQTVGCLAGMFPDMSLAFYVECTNGRFYYSTNSGSTWVYISLPDSWTWAGLSYSRTYKHIYINQSAASPKVYKLNDAKNGWDLFYSGATNTYGSVGCSELSDEITIGLSTSYNMYKVNQSGTATLIYTGTSSRAAPSIV